MDKNFCSVIIPVHNAELTIERALASLISNRNYICEVIIVDDGCTDLTISLVTRFFGTWFKKITVIPFSKEGEPQGPGLARQKGLNEATGAFVTFLDADDCLTPSCLRYVYDFLQEPDNQDIVLLHTQTIYYESGNFEPKDIEYSNFSCGGNYYKTKYLKDHNLTFHSDLWMAEDEYFNNKVIIYLDRLDPGKVRRDFYEYPAYEVHHDTADKLSFALSQWVEYSIKYHLLYMEYLVKDYIRYPKLYEYLRRTYIENIILVYLETQAAIQSGEEVKQDEIEEWFGRAIKYFEFAFMGSRDQIYIYAQKNPTIIKELLESVENNNGIKLKGMKHIEKDLTNFINKI